MTEKYPPYLTNPLPANAPKLMPYQEFPFNDDLFAKEKVIQLQKEFGIDFAIETGTCFGSTTIFLAQVFRRVMTFEINKKFLEFAIPRLPDNVLYMNCSSSHGIVEHEVLIQEKKVFYFLDAHWEKSCPLIDELKQIAFLCNSEGYDKPVIMIHDFKVPDRPDLGFDSYNGQDFEWEWIRPYVEEIYGEEGFNIEYNSQAGGAKRGIIYITPKNINS